MGMYKTSEVAKIIGVQLKRREVSEQLSISMDTLRNWEMISC